MNVTSPITVTTSAGSVVYGIQKVSPEDTVFANRTGGNSATAKRLAFGYSPANAARHTDKFSIDLDFPHIRTDPVMGNVAKDVSRIRVNLTVAETATAAEREEIYDTLVQAVSETLFAGSVKSFDLPT